MSITPEKRNSLIKLAGITLAVLFGFWFLLIRPAQTRVLEKNGASEELTKKIAAKKDIIQRSAQIKTRLDDTVRQLGRIEEQMVSGDAYLWVIKTLRDFEIPERLEFTKYDPPQITTPEVTAKLPYETASYVIAGNAAFHDLGKFLAKFENLYPHIRISRVDMEPAGVSLDADEKLTFLLELHVLVKPGSSSKSSPRS